METNLSGRESPLQSGDQIIAVEGLDIETLENRAHAFYALRPPYWPDGATMDYTVVRNGETRSLAVPLYRVAPWTSLGVLIQTQGTLYHVQLISSVFFFAVGLLVFLLRPRERAAHALLLIGTPFLLQGIPSIPGITSAFFPFPLPSVGFDYWSAAILPGIVYLMLSFPVPLWPIRRFPRLTPILLFAIPTLSLNLAYLLHLNDRAGFETAASIVYITEALATLLTLLIWIPYAAVTMRGPVERAQFGWVSRGLLSFILPGIGGWVLLYAGFVGADSPVVGTALSTTGWFLLPISLGIAITRYRLFDIAIIIRRTLVYSILSVVLGTVYFGGVALLQNIFIRLTGQTSMLAIVGSTLAIAALFLPLRRWVQDMIDRRFFRRRYDARQVVEQFARRAQRTADVDLLAADMLETVQDALEPEQARVWIVRK